MGGCLASRKQRVTDLPVIVIEEAWRSEGDAPQSLAYATVYDSAVDEPYPFPHSRSGASRPKAAGTEGGGGIKAEGHPDLPASP
jgi:hypothetical protein